MYEKFVELLQERNITPYRVAMDTGVTQTTLSDWKVGRATPKTATLQKIADYFNVSVDWLTGKSQFRNNNEIGEYYSGWGNYDPYFEPPFDFAKLLISEREEQGVSVEQMANVIGVTAEQYTEIEDGALPINYDQGEKLCAFLGTNVVQVLFDNELYSEEVPEEYHDDVQKWIRMKELIDNEAMCSVDSNITTNQEYNIIKKYRTLDEYGKKVVNSVIDLEYERCTAAASQAVRSHTIAAARDIKCHDFTDFAQINRLMGAHLHVMRVSQPGGAEKEKEKEPTT